MTMTRAFSCEEMPMMCSEKSGCMLHSAPTNTGTHYANQHAAPTEQQYVYVYVYVDGNGDGAKSDNIRLERPKLT